MTKKKVPSLNHILLLGSLITIVSSGCVSFKHTRTDFDNQGKKLSEVTDSASGLFMNSVISKLSVDHKTSQTYQGLNVGQMNNEVNTEAIKATGDVIQGVVSSAIEAGIKGSVKAISGK